MGDKSQEVLTAKGYLMNEIMSAPTSDVSGNGESAALCGKVVSDQQTFSSIICGLELANNTHVTRIVSLLGQDELPRWHMEEATDIPGASLTFDLADHTAQDDISSTSSDHNGSRMVVHLHATIIMNISSEGISRLQELSCNKPCRNAKNSKANHKHDLG